LHGAGPRPDRIDARKEPELFQLRNHFLMARGVLQEIQAVPVGTNGSESW